MPRGAKPGERRGGRAKGTPNKRSLIVAADTKARIAVALERNVSPLEVLLEQMYWYRDQAQNLTEKISELAVDITDPGALREFLKMMNEMWQFRQQARVCASEAAPYIHSRLASVVVTDEKNNLLTPEVIGKIDVKTAAEHYARALDVE